MESEKEKTPKKCTVCNTGELMPSGCGCNNKDCHNFVERWKPCGAGYDPPKPLPLENAPKPPSAEIPPKPLPVELPPKPVEEEPKPKASKKTKKQKEQK